MERGDSVMNALFFCVAREKIRPRHAVKFSMPCAWRGVKNFCAGNALWAAQWHADYADTTGWPRLFLVLVRLQILKFAVKREFWLRIAGIFTEKSKGFFFAKNITRCKTMKYQHFLCVFVFLHFTNANLLSFGNWSKLHCAHLLAALYFCVFVFLWKQVCVPIIYIKLLNIFNN